MDYDVIIAGGSFAGLTAAAQLRGRKVLLVEPHEIGSVQTSACGTLLAVLEASGTLNSLCQIHDSILLHLAHCTIEYPLPYSFCTFDYRTLCQRLLSQGDAEVLQASVLRHEGHIVYTTYGAFDAEILIDATGWRAALAANGRQHGRAHPEMNFGIETSIPVREHGLHFYHDPDRLGSHNIGWLFPVGAFSRAGLGSYHGRTRFQTPLQDFASTYFQARLDGRHGGYFPHRLQPATTDHVFRIGDAAGQCFPLTGEGIRPAMLFGVAAGRLARRVLAGEMREPEALAAYRGLVRRRRRAYRVLEAAQRILPGLPPRWIERVALAVRRPNWLDLVLRAYWNAANPLELAHGPTPEVGNPELGLGSVAWMFAEPETSVVEREA